MGPDAPRASCKRLSPVRPDGSRLVSLPAGVQFVRSTVAPLHHPPSRSPARGPEALCAQQIPRRSTLMPIRRATAPAGAENVLVNIGWPSCAKKPSRDSRPLWGGQKRNFSHFFRGVVVPRIGGAHLLEELAARITQFCDIHPTYSLPKSSVPPDDYSRVHSPRMHDGFLNSCIPQSPE
jgi:hypothetical protein